mmetsp:Transcript_16163/g.32736  ORF Transcript_16163/g.32736 Transcript_16163/m.32736 type:complete len:88 (+) Transcript_16163:1008-1271(+)
MLPSFLPYCPPSRILPSSSPPSRLSSIQIVQTDTSSFQARTQAEWAANRGSGGKSGRHECTSFLPSFMSASLCPRLEQKRRERNSAK